MATRGLPTWPWAGLSPEDLRPVEALVLDAVRAWVEATRCGAQPALAARLPLATEDVADAADPLDAALRALACPGGMGCRLCPRVTAAEARFLTGLALAQRGTNREAVACFLRLAPPAAACAALAPSVAFGQVLRRAGLLLTHPLRPGG
ncbi:hypothetical protein ACE7GA_20030 [Roseomonas sp. CCTCC AB2023176]|uniref:hypothetical protein n=1 Tax=Roseomonas sp. CCTCC AB2023176 TaxID=3342640 RepID=UPI0035DCD9FE